MDLHVGDLAPEVIIQVAENKQYALSHFRGKNVVLYFYPKDDTPGCTIEAKGFNDLHDEFQKANTVVVGISKDNLKSHDKFKEKYSLEFDLASDETTDIAKSYGVLENKSMFGKKYLGVNRTTFLINTKGYIEYVWKDVSVFGHAKEVLNFIKKHEDNK